MFSLMRNEIHVWFTTITWNYTGLPLLAISSEGKYQLRPPEVVIQRSYIIIKHSIEVLVVILVMVMVMLMYLGQKNGEFGKEINISLSLIKNVAM